MPVGKATEDLSISSDRFRKISGIRNALEMQIENGGDSPEVNKLLIEALRKAILHQVDATEAQTALDAIATFEQAENERWEQVKAGTLPPIKLTPEEKLGDLIEGGYDLLERQKTAAACDRWLEGWELFKDLATPDFKTVREVAERVEIEFWLSIDEWLSNLDMELHNAGLNDSSYHERRLRYAREFLSRFPNEGSLTYLNFMRAQGEALWKLGQRTESEAVYETLLGQMPYEGWAYIGWADNYYFGKSSPKEYDKAEAILKRALAQPSLKDYRDVIERLQMIYEESGDEENLAIATDQLERASRKLGRNELCWCGSRKKYKYCHMKSDRRSRK